jgi:hypothetical protein
MTPRPDDRLFIAFTADVDPDANRPCPGRPDAVSPGPGDRATFDACFDGLAALLGALDEHGLPATLFWEGRTLEELADRRPALLPSVAGAASLEHGAHGYRHEDFAGTVSGMPLDAARTADAVARAGAAVRDAFGTDPAGFRAPYCRLTDHLLRALADASYAYDASTTATLSPAYGLRPFRMPDEPRLHELALCRSIDARGRPISCYLWQLCEGNRTVDDYLHLLRSARECGPGGLLQIALHPWHLVVSAEGRALGDAPLRELRALLAQVVAEDGVAFTTAGAYLARSIQASGVRTPGEFRVRKLPD